MLLMDKTATDEQETDLWSCVLCAVQGQCTVNNVYYAFSFLIHYSLLTYFVLWRKWCKCDSCWRILLYISIGTAVWEDVWMFLAENMADSAAGDDLQTSSTHPDSEGELWRTRNVLNGVFFTAKSILHEHTSWCDMKNEMCCSDRDVPPAPRSERGTRSYNNHITCLKRLVYLR